MKEEGNHCKITKLQVGERGLTALMIEKAAEDEAFFTIQKVAVGSALLYLCAPSPSRSISQQLAFAFGFE